MIRSWIVRGNNTSFSNLSTGGGGGGGGEGGRAGGHHGGGGGNGGGTASPAGRLQLGGT